MTTLTIESDQPRVPPECMDTRFLPCDHSTRKVGMWVVRGPIAVETISACSADFSVFRTQGVYYVAFAGAPYAGIALMSPFVDLEDAIQAGLAFVIRERRT